MCRLALQLPLPHRLLIAYLSIRKRCQSEVLSKTKRSSIEDKAKFYRSQSEDLSKTKRRSIEDKAKFYRRQSEHLSKTKRTSIEDLSNDFCFQLTCPSSIRLFIALQNALTKSDTGISFSNFVIIACCFIFGVQNKRLLMP